MRDRRRCPRGRGWFVDRDTGQIKEARCQAYGCGFCGPRLAMATALAIELAAPRWSGVVTLRTGEASSAPAIFRGLAARMRRLTAIVRGSGRAWEAVWVVELSPRGIPHAHVLHKGSRLSSLEFSQAAHHAGLDWASTRSIVKLPPLARYVLKLPLNALRLNIGEARSLMRRHLDLNGGRLAHATRLFWTDHVGRPLFGVRKARVAALRLREASPSLFEHFVLQPSQGNDLELR